MKEITINFNQDGTADTIYTEAIDLTEIGINHIVRASHVEPNDDGSWSADMAPSDGPVLGPFRTRSEALDAEVTWLNNKMFG